MCIIANQTGKEHKADVKPLALVCSKGDII